MSTGSVAGAFEAFQPLIDLHLGSGMDREHDFVLETIPESKENKSELSLLNKLKKALE